MNYKLLPALFLLLAKFQCELYAQKRITISGKVIESTTNNPIKNVNITGTSGKCYSNQEGVFTLITNPGRQALTFSHTAYIPSAVSFELSSDTLLYIHLSPKIIEGQEVEIHAKAANNQVSNISTGLIELSKMQLTQLPTFMGEADPLKVLKLMPGIGNGGDANAGLYVRGGTAGQNLILYNDAQIYNPTHLLGFFSVFNSDAFDHISLLKAGTPAKYGGSLSSVLNVTTFKSFPEKTVIKGSVGFISAKVAADISVSPNFYLNLALRKTYLNLTVWPIIKSFKSSEKVLENPNYDFADLNINATAKLSNKNLLYFSAYSGRDDFGLSLSQIGSKNTMYWGNDSFSLAWSHLFNTQVSLKQTIGYSNYKLNFGAQQDAYTAKFNSGIKDLFYKNQLQVYHNRHQFTTGIQYTFHKLLPNAPEINAGDTRYQTGIVNRYFTHETALFAENEYKLNDRWLINTGLRFTNYLHTGPYTLLQNTENETTDTLIFAANKLVKAYNKLEPRIVLRYILNQHSSLKVSFEKRNQFIHLLAISAVNFPSDFWISSSKNLQPQTGNQYSTGYYRNLFNNRYEFSTEVYYRSMYRQIELNQSLFNFIDNTNFNSNLLNGSGRSFGAELMLQKKTGIISGWIAYTLAKTDRKFDELNKGERFPAKYDRRHDLSLVAIYQHNPKWNFSATFTYNTGNAFSLPVARYIIEGNIVNEFGPYNSFRMPDYHRLDVSAKYQLKQRKRFESSLDFSIYNVYNRNNPIYILFAAKGDIEKYKIQIIKRPIALLRMLPSVTWNFKF